VTCRTDVPFSDSVNLGSNPSPPATTNADKTGVSGNLSPSEKPEPAEQTAHTGRTKVGTSLPRVVCWFSCGDASAVATAMGLKKYRDTHEVVVARIVIPEEHPDNERFARECADWFGAPMTELRTTKYAGAADVWEKRRYMSGIAGAPCTTYLKKEVRYGFQRPTDIHVFGYTADARDVKRADELRETNFEIVVETPLIGAGLKKPDCHALVRAAGIELPFMYRLGFDNNNCIGCVKGGAGYWNKVRVHFPDVFAERARLSRSIGCRLVKQDGVRVFLDELRPTTGRQKDEIEIDCSAHCESAVAFLELETVSA
jgi:hypothetical protein